jgi:hypothetical protein
MQRREAHKLQFFCHDPKEITYPDGLPFYVPLSHRPIYETIQCLEDLDFPECFSWDLWFSYMSKDSQMLPEHLCVERWLYHYVSSRDVDGTFLAVGIFKLKQLPGQSKSSLLVFVRYPDHYNGEKRKPLDVSFEYKLFTNLAHTIRFGLDATLRSKFNITLTRSAQELDALASGVLPIVLWEIIQGYEEDYFPAPHAYHAIDDIWLDEYNGTWKTLSEIILEQQPTTPEASCREIDGWFENHNTKFRGYQKRKRLQKKRLKWLKSKGLCVS